MSQEDKQEGVIAAILSTKRYGFISLPGRKKDVFFHETAVRDEGGFSALEPGMKVSFILIDSDKGPKAVGVERAE